MNRQELIDGLSTDVLAYVMHGSFPERRFVREIKPDGLDERFDDFETLVRLHFVLRPEVVSFVKSLPSELRGIKTQTESVSRTVRGRVDGRINWHATVRKRYAQNPDDRSLFVCDDRTEDYDIDENLVLKKLLSIIYTTLSDCAEYLRADYEWVTDRWRENLELIDVLNDIVERNVHVTRIREPAAYEPTARMVQRTSDSRNDLYRGAARLLEEYRQSIEGEEETLRALLERTAITPDDDERLFELFVLFKYISQIDALSDEQFELRTIETGSQEVARMENDGTEIALYHDSSGADRGLSFNTAPQGDDPSAFSRYEAVQHESLEVAKQYFGTETLRHDTGRPDVIVLEVLDDDRREYIVTEVKHSTRMETIKTGITETLEYLAFLRQDSEFVNEDDYFGSGWNGVLVVQDLAEDTASLEEQRSMRILQASELEAKLQEVLKQVL